MNPSKKESTIHALTFQHEKITKIALFILQLCCVPLLLTTMPPFDTDKLVLVTCTTVGFGWFSGLLYGLFEQKIVKIYSIVSMCLVLVEVLLFSLWDYRSTFLYPLVIFAPTLLFVLAWRLCWTFLIPLRIVLITIASLSATSQISILLSFNISPSIFYAVATIMVDLWYAWLLSQKASHLHIYFGAVVFTLYYFLMGIDLQIYLDLLLTTTILMVCFEVEAERFGWIVGVLLVLCSIFGVNYLFS